MRDCSETERALHQPYEIRLVLARRRQKLSCKQYDSKISLLRDQSLTAAR